MNSELMNKAEEIVRNAKIATIGKIDDKGYPRTSMISNIKTEGLNTLWFTTGLTSSKVKFFTQNNKASVCYTDGENNVTLLGIVDILTDPDLKEQLWLDWFIHYFPGGVTDPNYCLLKFTTKEVHYWIDKQDGHISW